MPREGTKYDPGNKLGNDGAGIQTYVFLLPILTSAHPVMARDTSSGQPYHPNSFPSTLGQQGDLRCIDTVESKPSSPLPGKKSMRLCEVRRSEVRAKSVPAQSCSTSVHVAVSEPQLASGTFNLHRQPFTLLESWLIC